MKKEWVDISILLELLEEVGILEKEAYKFCGITRQGFLNWKKKGKLPVTNFAAFQTGLVIFLEEEKIRKMVKLGILSKEFLQELINE